MKQTERIHGAYSVWHFFSSTLKNYFVVTAPFLETVMSYSFSRNTNAEQVFRKPVSPSQELPWLLCMFVTKNGEVENVLLELRKYSAGLKIFRRLLGSLQSPKLFVQHFMKAEADQITPPPKYVLQAGVVVVKMSPPSSCCCVVIFTSKTVPKSAQSI